MPFDRSEIIAKQRKPPETKREMARTLQAVQQAAVKVEILTGDDNWDTFLSYLQATIRAAANARDRYMNDLADPRLVNDDEVSRRRIAVMRLNERISTLQAVMNIPKELHEGGEKAKIALEKLGSLDPDTEGQV